MRIGIDVGGTFTDFVLLDDATGHTETYKCLTTPRDPSDAIEEGVRVLAGRVPGGLDRLEEVIHGTTLVINAIIERKGARTGLLTTRGFRDVLELGREIRYAAYDPFAQMPEPLVPRERRLEVDERLRADGSILVPLDEEMAREVIRELARHDVASIAVCLLNSFENPAHELTLKRLLAEELPGVSVSISYEVLPRIREYERTSTTVTNAYVKPLTETYLRQLRERLTALGFRGRLFIMLSSGGVTSAETAAEFPVRIIESGPTAAVIAGQYYSRLFDVPAMFCFDMGGTTAKSCLVENGVAAVVSTFEVGRVQRFQKGSGLTIQVPVVDLMEIGAGGGSIARASRLGTLQVGPESAGAEPGPICYGRGGVEPTVTDADLLLGYLDPTYFLGGAMKLDPDKARHGIEERVARPLGVSFIDAVWGIHDLINETMAAAAKTHIAERGGNPHRVTVAAFGGAGPVHAYGLAAQARRAAPARPAERGRRLRARLLHGAACIRSGAQSQGAVGRRRLRQARDAVPRARGRRRANAAQDRRRGTRPLRALGRGALHRPGLGNEPADTAGRFCPARSGGAPPPLRRDVHAALWAHVSGVPGRVRQLLRACEPAGGGANAAEADGRGAAGRRGEGRAACVFRQCARVRRSCRLRPLPAARREPRSRARRSSRNASRR